MAKNWDKGVNVIYPSEFTGFYRQVGIVGNAAAEKENELTQVSYLDDCSDAQYYRGA